MQASYADYNFHDSVSRVDELLRGADTSYTDKTSIPDRSQLTYANGFYVNVTALFVDLRGSKTLSANHKKPTLAKIYRTYISETVAILRGHSGVNEIYIEGDGVWAVFDTPNRSDIDDVFSTSAQIISLIKILNLKFTQFGISKITAGVGIAYGESLYIKAGHKNSGVNDVVWLGKVIGEASQLCSFAARTNNDYNVMLSDCIYNNLSDKNRSLTSRNVSRGCYHADIINSGMEQWLKNNTNG